MSKYYTPELKEFYIGFEYEALVDYYKEEYGKFIVEDTDSMRSILSTWDRGEQEYWRVKYLNSEDIESCGFKEMERTVESVAYNMGAYGEYVLAVIRGYNEIMIMRNGFNLFRGKIKNLSELKRVLEMIRIEYSK